MAERPSLAVTTAYPLRSKLNRSVCKIADSSSTTRIFLLKSGLLTNVPRDGFVSSDPFIRFGDRAVIQRAVSFCRAGGIELVGKTRSRHGHTHRPRGIQSCCYILT